MVLTGQENSGSVSPTYANIDMLQGIYI